MDSNDPRCHDARVETSPSRLDGGTATTTPVRASVILRRVTGGVLAILGSAMLVTAQSLPWLSVRVGKTNLLLRDDAEQAVRMRLAELPEVRTWLYVGWVLLFAVVVAAWVRPDWRRGVVRAAVTLDVVLVFLTLDLGRTAVEVSGFQASDYPKTAILSGAVLALFGLLFTSVAVAVLSAPVRGRLDRLGAQALAYPPQPTVLGGGTGWSQRPTWVPWWRRRGPVTALVIGVVGLLLVPAMVVWLVLHRPAPARDHSGDLWQFLVTAPAGSTPQPYPSGGSGQPSLIEVVQLSDHPEPGRLSFQLLTIRRGVVDRWTEPDGTTVTIALLQSKSESTATAFLRGYQSQVTEMVDDSDIREVPGLPGAQSFVNPVKDEKGRFRIHAVVQRTDIVVLITEARPGQVDRTHINALVRDQYNRL